MTTKKIDVMQDLPPLRTIIAHYGLAAKKTLGQHFLLDLNITRRIVSLAGDLKGCTVFEVGPGPGGLTRALVASDAAKIIAVEKDDRCIEALDDLAKIADGKLEIISGDALKTDLTQLGKAPRAIVANLPYNVGTPLLLDWLRQIDAFQSLTLMFQAEVVDRLIATPGTKSYGRLSVLTQFCGIPKRVMTLPARAFTPPPNVDSAVVHITPRLDRPKDINIKTLETITAAAFGQRRKMLRSSLKILGGSALLEMAEIAGERRAEELTIAEFERLARALEKLKRSGQL